MAVYKWVLDSIAEETCESLSQKLSCQVKSITTGNIIVGETEKVGDSGELEKTPIINRGIELELEGETPEILEQIDNMFPELKREGSRDLISELKLLKARVDSLESVKPK